MSDDRRTQLMDSLAFAVVWGLSLWRVSRTALLDRFIDEDTHIATGWLLSRGLVLYRDIFSHHTPVDYIPAWLIAQLFDNRFLAYRGLMALLWAAVSLCLFLIWRRAGRVPAWGAILFTGLSAHWLAYWGGQMMLVESYWGYALLLALALIADPLEIKDSPPGSPRAFAAGALLCFVASASPPNVLPVSCLGAWLAADRRWRSTWRTLLAGAAAWLILLWFWCLGRVDFTRIYAHVWSFNADIYARFHGIQGSSSPLGFLMAAVFENGRYYSTVFSWGEPAGFFEGLLKLGVLGGLGSLLWRRERLKALWWAVFLVAVKSRTEFFTAALPIHGTAFYLLATLLVSLEFSTMFWAALKVSRHRAGILAAAGMAVFIASMAATSPEFREIMAYPLGEPAEIPVIEAIRRGTDPGDRIAVFPNASRIYFEAGRLPAVPNVFYLPWQAAWPPQRQATLEALRKNQPKIVAVKYGKIWGIPWSQYALDIEALLEQDYAPVPLDGSEPSTSVLHVLRTYRKEFERRLNE